MLFRIKTQRRVRLPQASVFWTGYKRLAGYARHASFQEEGFPYKFVTATSPCWIRCNHYGSVALLLYLSVFNFFRFFNGNIRCSWIWSPPPEEPVIHINWSCYQIFSGSSQHMLWATFYQYYSLSAIFLRNILLTSVDKWLLSSVTAELIAIFITGTNHSPAPIPYHYPSTKYLFLRAFSTVGNTTQSLP